MVYVAKICNLGGVCAHTALAYCKKRKTPKTKFRLWFTQTFCVITNRHRINGYW